ncbi:hypothetical protein CASFOL_032177 [Castilleja foliolosa]|uniref:PTM/DIR17-like Tudor domain-containing protein n=1 Tax=Castilleja foliolosa TaxID=1961234 RepID=A0ABD3C0T0_9LAMI
MASSSSEEVNVVAPDAEMVDELKKLVVEYGNEFLKPSGSMDELLKKLDNLDQVLSQIQGGHKVQFEEAIKPSKDALIADEYIRHSEMDVRISVVSCISEIIRILAPDDPYEDIQMEDFFLAAICAFESLSCMSGRAYTKAVSILRTMSDSHSCVLMLDIAVHDVITHMFCTFFDVIRASHSDAIFSAMENIMVLMIHEDSDCDESAMELAMTLLSKLKKENQNVSPVAFRLAESTFKKCSNVLKKNFPEASRGLGLSVDDYAEVVVSLFRDPTPSKDTDSKNDVNDTSCHGEASLPIDGGPSTLAEVNETEEPEKIENFESDENFHENQQKTSQSPGEPDNLGSPEQQQEILSKSVSTRGKRSRKRHSLIKLEEGYHSSWLLGSWAAMKNSNRRSGNKKRKRRGHPPKDINEENRRSENSVSDDLEGNIIAKDHLKNRQESSDRKGKGRMVITEDETEDDRIEDSENDVDDTSCHGEASLPNDGGPSTLAEGNETEEPEKIDNFDCDENFHENQQKTSLSCGEPDNLLSPERQQEMLSENVSTRGKRSRKRHSLIKLEEGYHSSWLLGSYAAMKNSNRRSRNKKRKRSGHPPKDIIEENCRSKNSVSDDLEGNITAKNHLETRQESSDRKGKGKMVISEDETEDDRIETLAFESNSVSSEGKALSGELSNPLHASKSTTSNQEVSEVRDAANCLGDELVGRRVKVWWPLDQMFYEGEITLFDHLNKRHKVTYDDGESESLDLAEECWLFLDKELKTDITQSASTVTEVFSNVPIGVADDAWKRI